MRRPRLLLLAGLLPLAACTSFADSGPGATASSTTSAATSTSAAPTSGGDLAVTDEEDLGSAADTVTAARVVVAEDGTVSTLVVGAQTSTVRTGGSATVVTGTLVADLVATPDGPLGVTLTAAAVPADPVLGILPLGDPTAGEPVPLSPEQTAPRGLPVHAALSPDGTVLYVLAESTDGVGAQVYAVDPDTGELQDSTEVDTGFSDVTALALGGLTVTGDGDLVVGLTLDSDDGLAAGGTAAPVLRLDPDLRPSGEPVQTQEGSQRTEVLAVATGADGDPLALVSGAAGLQLVDLDLDAGTSSARPVDGVDEPTRAGAVAAGADTTVVTLLDQDAPTVVVTRDGAGDTLQLCDGTGDALAVTATADGFLVVGTCAGTTRLWTLGG